MQFHRPRTKRVISSFTVSVAALCWGIGASSAFGQPGKIYQEQKNRVVTLEWREVGSGQVRSSGTGFLRSSTELVTNWHVLANDLSWNWELYAVLPDGREQQIGWFSSVLWASESADLVVASWPSVGIDVLVEPIETRQEDVSVGDEVLVIGSPHGLQGSLTTGIVSGLREGPSLPKTLQMSAAVSPGSSGSPVFDSNGRLVAIVTSRIADGEALNFAVAASCLPRQVDATVAVGVREWAKSAVTVDERDFALGRLRQATSLALKSIQQQLEKSDPSLEEPDPIAGLYRDELLEARRAILDGDIQVLDSGERVPPSSYWFTAFLFGQSGQSGYNDFLRLLSGLDGQQWKHPRLLKAVSEATSSESFLEHASRELPRDDRVRCRLIEALNNRNAAILKHAFSVKDAGLADIGGSLVVEQMRERSTQALQHLGLLEEANPGWGRVPWLWHERFKAYVVLGQFVEAKEAYGKRFALRFEAPSEMGDLLDVDWAAQRECEHLVWWTLTNDPNQASWVVSLSSMGADLASQARSALPSGILVLYTVSSELEQFAAANRAIDGPFQELLNHNANRVRQTYEQVLSTTRK